MIIPSLLNPYQTSTFLSRVLLEFQYPNNPHGQDSPANFLAKLPGLAQLSYFFSILSFFMIFSSIWSSSSTVMAASSFPCESFSMASFTFKCLSTLRISTSWDDLFFLHFLAKQQRPAKANARNKRPPNDTKTMTMTVPWLWSGDGIGAMGGGGESTWGGGGGRWVGGGGGKERGGGGGEERAGGGGEKKNGKFCALPWVEDIVDDEDTKSNSDVF